jgi:hypothetical protein
LLALIILKNYYIPSKGMGMDPSENEIWTDFNGIEKHIKTCIEKNKLHYVGKKHKFVFRIFYRFGKLI